MLQRGTYGIEWTERPGKDEPSLLGRLVVVVIGVALISLGWTVVSRIRANRKAAQEESELSPPAVAQQGAPSLRGETTEPTPQPKPAVEEPPPSPPPPPPVVSRPESRPPKVRNLLMRLEEAEKAHNVEMVVTTIEALRALPGAPAADLDNALARRLGVLNVRRLFDLKNAQWVATVVVKSGDAASRIASEHGSTFASLAKLNGGNVDRLKVGQKLSVLNHPRFNLVVHRLAKIADLQLNGKFFKRYDLEGTTNLKDGAFEWREVSLKLLKATDKAELDMLLPRSTSVLISEM